MVLLLLNHGSDTTLEGANGTAKQVALTAKQLGIYQVRAITTHLNAPTVSVVVAHARPG